MHDPIISRAEYDGTTAPVETGVTITAFGRWLRAEQESLIRSYKSVEPIIFAVAAFGVVGMPLYYVIWEYLFPQAHESLELRLVGSLLCGLTWSMIFWPSRYRETLGPALWFTTVTYCLPFFFTYMLLKNGGSPVWLVTWLLGFALIALVVEFVGLVTLLTVGILAAVTAYFATGGTLVTLEKLIEQIPVFLFTIIAGTVAIYRQQVVRQTLTRARDAAEAANRAKSEFLAMMSHEIRTPMNGVLGMTGVLLDSPLTDDQRRYVRTIRESGEGLLRIINDVLDFSKLEAEAVEFEDLPFDLHALLSYSVDIVTPRANAKALRLELVIGNDVPRFVKADAGRVRQVVLNLLGNAVKFTEQGRVRIAAEVIGGTVLRVEVCDTGIGIGSDQMPKLFESFTQADATISRRFGGSGLGLAIARKLVTRMGGRIGAESTLGGGSIFWFELPLFAATEDEVEAMSVGIANDAFLESQRYLQNLGRPIRVLVAEDNATNQVVVKSVLSKFGITPDVVGDGSEAVDAVRRAPYDVILMDVHMPEMDGLEASRAIRLLKGDAAHTPIVALTANALSGDFNECRAAGMNAFVSKPFKTEDLLIAIANAVRGVETVRRPSVVPEGDATAVNWTTLENFRKQTSDDVFRELMDTYLNDTAAKLKQLHQLAATAPASKDAVRIVHAFKSSSAMTGADALSKMAAALEYDLHLGKAELKSADADKMSELFQRYRDAVVARGLAS